MANENVNVAPDNQPADKKRNGWNRKKQPKSNESREAAIAKNNKLAAALAGKSPMKAELARRAGKNQKPENSVRVSFLGGLNEIGKNITMYETDNDIVLVDCGMAFPGEEMPGIDLVIPDFSYLEKNHEKIRGVVLTHGHEDHIGGLPYLLKKLDVPVYGTRLTLGLVENKLREHGILERSSLNVVKAGQMVNFGTIQV